jgi:predicted RNA-binding protein with PUA-like domain
VPGYWVVKSEPSTYSFAQLQADGRTRWDGIRNPQALLHIREMQVGDLALFYHTGGEKQVVGIARVVSAPYPDPKADDPKATVVDLAADRALPKPVTLAAIKAEPSLSTLGLVRQGRLSVVPVPAAQWKLLLGMAGGR